MNFINPFYLFALSAASIPIIIHLLNLRKQKKIEFSTLFFLKEMQKTNSNYNNNRDNSDNRDNKDNNT